jgi:tRNA pseudouridine 55 synthase
MQGVLIIDKAAGLTSHDVVAKVRRILKERRVGHTGTLDPFATGVLVVLVGGATRLAQFLSGSDKEYEAVIRLGFATDTGDLTGKPLEPSTKTLEPWSRDEVETALAGLRGQIDQVPPMYSAKKQGGKKLYELARRGEQVEREPARVKISVFEMTQAVNVFSQNSDGTTDIQVRVVCSAGTYIRTLAEDLGKRLGVGAHVAELRRTRAGQFDLQQSLTLEQLETKVQQDGLADFIVSPDVALEFLPQVCLSSLEVQHTQQGRPLKLSTATEVLNDAALVRMRDQLGKLIAVGSYDIQTQLLRPRVVLS